MYNLHHTAFFVTVFLASLSGSLYLLGEGGVDSMMTSGKSQARPVVRRVYYHLRKGIFYLFLGFVASYCSTLVVSYFANNTARYLAPLALLSVLLAVYMLYARHSRGWCYPFVLLAAGSGGEIVGGVVMLAFWLGTLPVVFMSGFVPKRVVVGQGNYFLVPLFLVILASTICITLQVAPSKHDVHGVSTIGSVDTALPERCVH